MLGCLSEEVGSLRGGGEVARLLAEAWRVDGGVSGKVSCT